MVFKSFFYSERYHALIEEIDRKYFKHYFDSASWNNVERYDDIKTDRLRYRKLE